MGGVCVCVCLFVCVLSRDMYKVCMPDDLFQQYAASHPNDPGVTQTQRVFSLLLMMREDKVSPLEETYRWVQGSLTVAVITHVPFISQICLPAACGKIFELIVHRIC